MPFKTMDDTALCYINAAPRRTRRQFPELAPHFLPAFISLLWPNVYWPRVLGRMFEPSERKLDADAELMSLPTAEMYIVTSCHEATALGDNLNE